MIGKDLWSQESHSGMMKRTGKTIGEGTFGKVKLGTHLLTGEKARKPSFLSLLKVSCKQVAIKFLEKEKIKDKEDIQRVAREIHILKLIRHPNVIQLYEVPSYLLVISYFPPHSSPFRSLRLPKGFILLWNTHLEESSSITL